VLLYVRRAASPASTPGGAGRLADNAPDIAEAAPAVPSHPIRWCTAPSTATQDYDHGPLGNDRNIDEVLPL
jgi:hypothetical protein